jgi:hypothetical protein
MNQVSSTYQLTNSWLKKHLDSAGFNPVDDLRAAVSRGKCEEYRADGPGVVENPIMAGGAPMAPRIGNLQR